MKRATHKFSPEFSASLVQVDRGLTFDPDMALKDLGLKTGMTAADIGAGPGYFTAKIAKMVGHPGKVYAVDIQEEMLVKLKKNLEAQGLKNFETVLSKENHIPMPDGTVDLCFMSSVLHELYDPTKFLREIARILKKGGLLGVIDWKKESSDQGPPLEERIGVDEAEKMIAESGGRIIRTWDNGAHQYFIKAGY
jgi:ubiquinone/menaquinone biosynthesis C-methylase UbiE